MNTTVSLVQSLRELSPAQQRHILQLRLSSVTGLRDWFDVADALLAPEAIDRALAVLARSEIIRIADETVSSDLLATLREHGLASETDVYPEVTARACELRPDDSSAEPEASVALDERYERAALERATVLVTQVEELIDLMRKRGLRTVSRGSVSAADATRVTTAISGLPEDLTGLLQLMASAGIVELNAGIWSTADTTQWNNSGVAQRWGQLTDGWARSMSTQLRQALAERSNWGLSLESYLVWLFPIDASVITAEARRMMINADALGLRTNEVRSAAGEATISGRISEAVALVDALLPDYIDKVLVQSDLTVVSPGPLRPDLEAKLRAIALVESRSVASTYRLNAHQMSRAMDAGTTAADIEAFLTDVSGTGIPQPVAYLIADVGLKHATIRVRPEAHGTLITCSEVSLAARLAADVSLRALGLVANGPATLTSPHDASVVMRNLHNEKYPAALESDTGEIQPWEPAVAPLTGTTQAVNAIAALVERLGALATPVGESDDQWLVRQIEVAIRNRSLVNVTVALPDGSTRDFLIDPRGLSNGRFRGLDRKSEVERTLPLSSITAISIAEVA
jgi:hypothetical protein